MLKSIGKSIIFFFEKSINFITLERVGILVGAAVTMERYCEKCIQEYNQNLLKKSRLALKK